MLDFSGKDLLYFLWTGCSIVLSLSKDRLSLRVYPGLDPGLLGKLDKYRFNPAVDLEIEVPGVDYAKAEELARMAHAICPYSNATRGNIDVNLIVKQTVSAIAN